MKKYILFRYIFSLRNLKQFEFVDFQMDNYGYEADSDD